MKTLALLLINRLKRSHALTIRRSRIDYQNRHRPKTPIHTQLHLESILK